MCFSSESTQSKANFLSSALFNNFGVLQIGFNIKFLISLKSVFIPPEL